MLQSADLILIYTAQCSKDEIVANVQLQDSVIRRLLVWVPEEQGSWVLPISDERITSFESAMSKAAFQLKQVSRQLAVRPLAAFDRHYGNGKFLKQTAEIEELLQPPEAKQACSRCKGTGYIHTGYLCPTEG
jgi:hypothetical protein